MVDGGWWIIDGGWWIIEPAKPQSTDHTYCLGGRATSASGGNTTKRGLIVINQLQMRTHTHSTNYVSIDFLKTRQMLVGLVFKDT